MSDDWDGARDIFASELPTPAELENRAEEPGVGDLARHMDRIERRLDALCGVVARKSDLEGADLERRSEFVEVRGKLTDLSFDVARIAELRSYTATRSDVDSVLKMARDEFGWLRECHAWLRGAVSVLPSARRASGVVALCILWVLAAVAAFGVGAMMLGVVTVSVGWKGNGLAERASMERRPAAFAGAMPSLGGSVRTPGEFVLPPGEEPLREQYSDRAEERRGSVPQPLAVPRELAPADRKNVEEGLGVSAAGEVSGRLEKRVGPTREDFRVDAAP